MTNQVTTLLYKNDPRIAPDTSCPGTVCFTTLGTDHGPADLLVLTHQVCSYFRAFTFALLSAWNISPQDLSMVCIFSSFRPLLEYDSTEDPIRNTNSSHVKITSDPALFSTKLTMTGHYWLHFPILERRFREDRNGVCLIYCNPSLCLAHNK